MVDKQIQEQAEKYAQFYGIINNPVNQSNLKQAFIAGAQWMQEREKQAFLDHVNKINLTQRDKDLIKGVYYEFLSLHSPPKD